MGERHDEMDLSAFHFDADGLMPTIAQEAASGDVLLLAYVNAEALRLTWRTGEAHFWSRSRQRLWRKGEISGRRLLVEHIALNCEGNSLLLTVRLEGDAACHDGYRSCFYRAFDADGRLAIRAPRLFAPEAVYGDGDAPAAPAPLPRGAGSEERGPDEAAEGAGAVEDAAVADDLRALYACYLRLRDEDYTGVSATSRLLRDDATAATWLLGRAHEELAELRGVVAGVHWHTGGAEDVILEASQTLYWLLLAAARVRLAYDDWRPHEALMAGWTSGPTLTAAATPIAPIQRALWELGATLRSAGTPPDAPIAADLASVRRRLAAFPDGASADGVVAP